MGSELYKHTVTLSVKLTVSVFSWLIVVAAPNNSINLINCNLFYTPAHTYGAMSTGTLNWTESHHPNNFSGQNPVVRTPELSYEKNFLKS